MSDSAPDDGGDPLVPFIHGLLIKMVDHPEQVEVRVEAGHPTLYEAKVAPDDIGQVVGREGRIVKALRTLVAAAAQKRGDRATFEIAEPRA
jgi:predicted RNA-binding protein YlqC (UPF0109 family)